MRTSRTALPVTPGALAAVALDHLAEKPDHIEVSDLGERRGGGPTNAYWQISGPRTVAVDLRFNSGEATDGDLVELSAGPSTPAGECLGAPRCEVTHDDRGTWVVTWDEEAPEEDPGYVAVTLHTAKDSRSILLAGPEINGDPRHQDLDIVGSVAEMKTVLAAPGFGFTTSQEALDAGHELKKFKHRDDPAPPPAPSKPWTVAGLSAVVYGRVNGSDYRASTFVEPPGTSPVGKGIAFDAFGPTVDLLIAPAESGEPACPSGYECDVRDGETYAWAPGRAAILRARDGFTVRLYVRAARLNLSGPDGFVEDEDLRRLVGLVSDPDVAPMLSTDWAAYASEIA